MNPLDRLTEVISRLMGKEPSDPDVLEAVVEVVMAMRPVDGGGSPREYYVTLYLDALLTEGEG